jgi:hypothetical protein
VAGSRVPDVVNAAVDGLRADATLISASLLNGSKVFTHVEQGTTTPYCVVLGGDEAPWSETFGEDNGGRTVDVLVQCVSTYKGSKQVDDVASQVMETLLDSDTWSAVDDFGAVQFVRNTAQLPVDLNADGVLWFVRVVTVRVTLV